MSETSKKIVLLAMAVVMALGLGEIVLRVIDFGAITPEMNFGVNTRMALDKGRFLPDADLFWKLPSHPRDMDIRAIQPDVQVPPKGQRRRILVLGDSCSRLSMAVPPYSALLEDSLQSHGVEVWNAAVPGYTSWQGLAWLHKQLLAMQPDVAVIYFGWNDHWRATGITDRDYAKQLRGPSLRLARLFRKMPDPPPLRVTSEQYRENLQVMVAELEAIGTRVVLVAAPASLTQEARARILQTRYLVRGDNAGAIHQEYLEVVHEVCAGSGAHLLDAGRIFSVVGAPKQLLMRDGVHLTDKGHQLMATLLATQLVPLLDNDAGSLPGTEALAARAQSFMQTGEVR
ncbi:MAG: GDSL-type esterase/lipase family protein [Candidatus Krumholzibacteriota bacterium]